MDGSLLTRLEKSHIRSSAFPNSDGFHYTQVLLTPRLLEKLEWLTNTSLSSPTILIKTKTVSLKQVCHLAHLRISPKFKDAVKVTVAHCLAYDCDWENSFVKDCVSKTHYASYQTFMRDMYAYFDDRNTLQHQYELAYVIGQGISRKLLKGDMRFVLPNPFELFNGINYPLKMAQFFYFTIHLNGECPLYTKQFFFLTCMVYVSKDYNIYSRTVDEDVIDTSLFFKTTKKGRKLSMKRTDREWYNAWTPLLEGLYSSIELFAQRKKQLIEGAYIPDETDRYVTHAQTEKASSQFELTDASSVFDEFFAGLDERDVFFIDEKAKQFMAGVLIRLIAYRGHKHNSDRLCILYKSQSE